MRKIIQAVALAATLALAGCATGGLGTLVKTATSTITNPVDANDIYAAKNAYAAGLQAVVSYREYCWSKPYAVLIADPVMRPVCQNRRAVVRAAQQQRPKAAAAIRAAQNFVRDNPTLNAATAIAAAWQAVTDFKSAIPAIN